MSRSATPAAAGLCSPADVSAMVSDDRRGSGGEVNPRLARPPSGWWLRIQAQVNQDLLKAAADDEGVGPVDSAKGWSPATVSRMLDNEKYVGRWVWNKTATRRDPRTGRRRRFPKPKSEWIIHEDEELRIVPQELWDRVRQRRKQVRKAWPGGKGRRGFSRDQKGQHKLSPSLSGLVCARPPTAMSRPLSMTHWSMDPKGRGATEPEPIRHRRQKMLAGWMARAHFAP
jgi:hypothetical protein